MLFPVHSVVVGCYILGLEKEVSLGCQRNKQGQNETKS